MEMEYNGGLTREQFLFYEIRIVAGQRLRGLSDAEVIREVREENLFQFPTERMVTSIARACLRRLDALDSVELTGLLANGPAEVAKQVNLYAMMCRNGVVWDFMTTVIGEKYRTQELDFSARDLNLFFFRLREQNDTVAGWSEATVQKIKQVLKKSLVECGYLDSARSDRLNTVLICPELEDAIRERRNLSALPAFNCFR